MGLTPPHTITSGNIIIDFPSPRLTSAFTNPSPPAAAVICGQPLKGLILLKIAGWLCLTKCENQLKISWIYTKGTELSIMFWDMYEKVQNCP